MHHALFISEIFREICGMMAQSSLPAVARTCHALYDPALDELWRDLYSIYPFVYLLAQAMPGENQQTSVQSLTSQQWTTLRRYSARTRSLYMCMIDDLPYFDRFPCLSNPPDPDSFFPNLRTVAWYPDNHLSMLPLFRLLCGPALTSLSVEFATDPASLAMVADLGVLCPNITNISVSPLNDALSDDLMNALSTSICHWNDLKHVACDDLTVPAIEHLSQSRNLESLTASASARMSSFSQTLSAQELSFPRLQHLHLYTTLLSTTTTCLRGLRLGLKEFRLHLFDAEVFLGSSCLRDLFMALVDTCSHASFRKLYLCIIYPSFPSPNSASTIRDVRPLFSFSHLRVLSLEGLSTFTFDDDDIAELASAWPNIEELALSTFVDHPIASLPTFQSLICLVHSCSKLRALSLVIDTTKLDPPLLHTVGCDVWSDVLEELCVGNSPVGSPIIVAHILHTLYPGLKQVDLSVWSKEPLNRLPRRGRYEVSWGTVNIELQNLREKETRRCRELNA
ncbi:hypothetical protein HD554DRAFT_1815288 [Boletus coccyginus]|nr:hypothetical protein HD554DRAFT_1815288 [Boletus coccyginus]